MLVSVSSTAADKRQTRDVRRQRGSLYHSGPRIESEAGALTSWHGSSQSRKKATIFTRARKARKAISNNLLKMKAQDQLQAIMNELRRDEDSSREKVPYLRLEAVILQLIRDNPDILKRDTEEMLVRAFKAFDPEGKGYIDAEELRSVLTSRGEPFTEEEMKGKNGILPFAAHDKGVVYYEELASALAHDGREL